jgi:hypothetical protein
MLDPQKNEVARSSITPAQGSLADVLLAVLDDYPKKFLKLLLIIASISLCLAGIVFTFVLLVIRSLPSRATQIELGPASILFSQTQGGLEKYLLVVPPQGWTKTDIYVPEGAILEINAGGKVQIDLAGLNAALGERYKAERRIQEAKNHGELGNVSDKDFDPDDYFTNEELKAMTPRWKWVGPDGASDEEMKAARPARRQRSILPNHSYGVLIAAFDTRNVDPTTDPSVIPRLVSSAFKVGSSYQQRVTATQSGYLYFAINDVQSKKPELPDMFLADNLGAFFAKVSVMSK